MKFLSCFQSRATIARGALLFLFCGWSSITYAAAENTHSVSPRLVLQLTVDGLRADLLTRSPLQFGDGGFRYLLETGSTFTNAHYEHANTETIVGHATLATGAHPAVHGMTGNVWYDATTGELAYNIEDPEHPILPSREHVRSGVQVDPSQQLARTQGCSPAALLAESFADKLASYNVGRSEIYAVSGKDRSAVAMAGKAGKAFWYSTDTGDFVSSTYYFQRYPDWVVAWNDERRAESFAGKTWDLLHPDINSYRMGEHDDRPFEADLRGYGRTFPHRFGAIDSGLLPTQLIASPVGDELLADFARELIEHESIGQDDVVDYLSVSFSGIDAVNHFFGPSSLETEDAILQLDRTLAGLLNFIDQAVGLERTIIVLSADHGAAEMPEQMVEYGFSADRLYPEAIIGAANRIGSTALGIDEVVRFYYRPYLYLNHDLIVAAKQDPENVRTTIARELTGEPGIELALSPEDLRAAPESKLIRQVRNNYHRSRSGDIYVVQAPYWFNFDKGPVRAMHGSPWNYDTHVPVVFAGRSIPAAQIHRPIQPTDIAPTLAALLGMTPPASAAGTALPEVLVRADD